MLVLLRVLAYILLKKVCIFSVGKTVIRISMTDLKLTDLKQGVFERLHCWRFLYEHNFQGMTGICNFQKKKKNL